MAKPEGAGRPGSFNSPGPCEPAADPGRPIVPQSLGIVLNPTPFADRKKDRSEAQTAGSAYSGSWFPGRPPFPTVKVPPRGGRGYPVDKSSTAGATTETAHNGPRPAGVSCALVDSCARAVNRVIHNFIDGPGRGCIRVSSLVSLVCLALPKLSTTLLPLYDYYGGRVIYSFLKKPGTRSTGLPAHGLLRRLADREPGGREGLASPPEPPPGGEP
jgi:hypothetical protein